MMNNQTASNATRAIDRIVSSQPELEPNVPDGGFGWIIFLSAIFFKCLVPSLITGYGIFLLFSKLEHSTFTYPMLWDDHLMYAPLIFAAVWTSSASWSRQLVLRTAWTRMVGITGVCLLCTGLLFMWIAINGSTKLILFVLSGLSSGIGASIISSQTDVLLAQYFRLKLPIITNILGGVTAAGFIAVPIVLGNGIIKHGLLRSVLCYQAVMLQGIVLCLTFQKPRQVSSSRRLFDFTSVGMDDEEDVFTKNMRELDNKREDQANTETAMPTENTNHIQPGTSTEDRTKWVQFNSDEGASSTKNALHLSFGENATGETDANNKFEDNFVEPRPLFNSSQVNNNTTYSYDLLDNAVIARSEPDVFVPTPTSHPRNNLLQNIDYLNQPTFYKSLLTIVTTKFSEFTFYTLFPSYLYVRIDSLQVHHVTSIVGYLAITGLIFMIFTAWLNQHTDKRSIILWTFCWCGSVGYFLLSDTIQKPFLIVGAIQVILSINTLQYVGEPLLGLTKRGESNQYHMAVSIFTGFAFTIFLIMNFSYVNCFRMMALLQFATGTIWLANFVYKGFKK